MGKLAPGRTDWVPSHQAGNRRNTRSIISRARDIPQEIVPKFTKQTAVDASERRRYKGGRADPTGKCRFRRSMS